MKTWSKLIMGLCGLAALAAAVPAGAAEVIYAGAGFIRGQQSGTESFSISGPGTLTVELTNVPWPEQLASLNLVVSSASGIQGTEMGPGTESFQLTAGTYYAQWFATAQGPLNVGVYSVALDFLPSGVNPVPLPTSIALLVSGLVLLGWQRRHRREFPTQGQLATQ
jgi:hypothetical protein